MYLKLDTTFTIDRYFFDSL